MARIRNASPHPRGWNPPRGGSITLGKGEEMDIDDDVLAGCMAAPYADELFREGAIEVVTGGGGKRQKRTEAAEALPESAKR